MPADAFSPNLPAGHRVGDQGEALAVAIRDVEVAHAGELADFDQRLRLEALAFALAVFIQAAQAEQRVAGGVERYAEDVLGGVFPEPVLIFGAEVAVADLERRERRDVERAVGVEADARYAVILRRRLAVALNSCRRRPIRSARSNTGVCTSTSA